MNAKTYAGNAGEMLTIAKTIAENLKPYIVQFSFVKTTFTENYPQELLDRIKEVTDKYLGNYRLAEQTTTTQQLYKLIAEAKKYMSILKIVIKNDFGEESAAMLKQLGFKSEQTKKVNNNDQEAIFTQLQGIKSGLTDSFLQKLKSKNVSEVLTNRLIELSTEVSDTDVKQEVEKSNGIENTKEANTAYISIYHEIALIGKIALKIIADKDVARQKFGYSYILRQLSGLSNNTNNDAISEEE